MQDHLSLAPAYTWTKRDLFMGLLQGACLLCAALQWCIAPDAENMVCVALVTASSSLVFQYLWRSRSWVDYPVSSLAMLGLCVTTQYAALVAQTMSWAPFTEFLRWPLSTFSVLAGVQVLAVGTHFVYQGLAATNAATAFLTRTFVAPIGVMAVPPVNMIWLMSVLGAYAMATGGGVATGDVGGKAFQAFGFLAFMPFLIPIYYRQHGEAWCKIKFHGPLLMAYVAVLIAVAMALNARQFMAIGPVQACLIFLLYFMRDPQPITRRTLMRLGSFVAVVSLAIVLFADLSIAMVINRDKRASLSGRELIEETIRTLGDRTRIAQYKQASVDQASYMRYDETYLANPMMARFSETKFHDNNIHFSTIINEVEREEVWRDTFDKVLAILPQTFIELFEIDVNKDELAYSFGDFYRYLNEGTDNTLGGYAVGSLWAHLIALFGLAWAPVVVVLMFMPAFVVLDAFSRRGGQHLDVSPVIMCSTWTIFSYALGGESLVWRAGFFLREFPQKLMLYLIVFAAIKYGFMLFGQRIDPPAKVADT